MQFDHQTWDLELYPGGSQSAAFDKLLSEIRERLQALNAVISAPPASMELAAWTRIIKQTEWLKAALVEADSFIACLEAQNVHDDKARQLSGIHKKMSADYASSMSRLDALLLKFDEQEWQALLQQDELKNIAYHLTERWMLALEKLSPDQEAIIHSLAVDGYHAWGELYSTAVGRFKLTYELDGVSRTYSAGQAANLLDHPDRKVRREVFRLWEEAWSMQADLCAAALNHLAGFRLNVYEQRGWSSVLKEPLQMSRMSERTLNAMWDAINSNKAPFLQFLRRKAQLMGVEKLSWYDVEAPLYGSAKKVPYDEAAAFILQHFAKFSPEMSAFAERVFRERWIESEDRADKRPGGFCTSFPLSKETRIFMTYSGTASNVSTLAHELGHAYHDHVMNDLPMFARDYAMNVAETASTFAELIVSDAAVRSAATDQERIALLEEKVQSAVTFYMNIQARFLFETAFYEQRKNGPLSVKQLCTLMESAQREAFGDELAEVHPNFWASKLHFYLTDVPFYNFPYTFGYLFSSGIYARAEAEGAAFASKYVALLRDTGSMTVEELAMKHLHVDLTQPEFWVSAINKTAEDAALFLQLTE